MAARSVTLSGQIGIGTPCVAFRTPSSSVYRLLQTRLGGRIIPAIIEAMRTKRFGHFQALAGQSLTGFLEPALVETGHEIRSGRAARRPYNTACHAQDELRNRR